MAQQQNQYEAIVKARYAVLIDVDENGCDDDVFVVSAIVDASTPEEAMVLGEAKAIAIYGKNNVLGAWDAREIE